MPVPPSRTADDVDRGLASLRYWLRVLHVMERRQMETLTQQWDADVRRKYEGDSDGPIPPDKESRIHVWIAAHTLALAMRHTEVRIKRLQSWGVLPPEATGAANRYLSLYGSEELKDLRDALEHSDEYATGSGNHADRIVDDVNSWRPDIGWGVRHYNEPDVDLSVLSRISIFGRDYSVEAILDAAHDMATALGVFGAARQQELNGEATE